MRSLLRNVAGLAVGVALLATAAPAPAQFGPSVMYNYQFGLAPAVSYNPWLPGLPLVPGRYSYSGYTLTGTGLNGPYSVGYAYYHVGLYGGGGYGGGYGGVGMGSGYFAGEGSRVLDQQRAAIAAAQRNAKWDTGVSSSTPEFDTWLKEQSNRRETRDPAAGAKVNPALLHPTDEAVLSGDVLNELAALVTDLEGKGKKADAGLCAPDLLARVVFSGAGADAANQFRHTEITFPAPLRAMEFDDLRAGLQKAYTPLATTAYAGKKVSVADVDRLLKEIPKARDGCAAFVKAASVDDAQAVVQFFNKLEAATKYLKEPTATGVAGVKWVTLGATVAELVKHANKYKLRFGKAAAGEEAAYYSLHRGLLAYYAGLLQAK